jgi:hypothetical protein
MLLVPGEAESYWLAIQNLSWTKPNRQEPEALHPPHVHALMCVPQCAGGVWLTPPRLLWWVLLLCWALRAAHR